MPDLVSKPARANPTIPRSSADSLSNIADGFRQLKIPKDEQDRMVNFLYSNSDNLSVIEYVGMLMNPKFYMRRYMDPFSRPTALVRSIATFDVPCWIDATGNSGRFSCAIQPTLGSPDGNSPTVWKQALVNGLNPWPTDFTVPASFIQVLNGRDLRVDPFYEPLTQGPSGFLSVYSNAPGSMTPFAGGTSTVAVEDSSLGISFTIRPSTNGRWYLQPGSYVCVVVVSNPAPTTIDISAPTDGASFEIVFNQLTSVNPSLVVLINVANVNQYFELTLNTPTSTNILVNFSTTLTANGGAPSDFGPVSQIRPLAMSCLASYMGTTLQDGGMIAAGYVPGGTLDSNYFTTANGAGSLGNFTSWENLSLSPNSYNGPLRDGAYVWWSPEDVVDTQMLKPSLSAAHEFPSLIVSGQFNPNAATLDAAVPVVRLEIVTVYEFVTNLQLYEVSSCVGSAADMDLANKLLVGQPHAMTNKLHLKWLTDFFKDVGSGIGSASRFIVKNAPKALPIIEGLAGAL